MERLNILIPSILGMIATGAMGWYVIAQQQATSPPQQERPQKPKISALGRLEPQSEVIKLSIPAFLNNDRVAALYVKQGDLVKKDQIVAILDSRNRMESVRDRTRREVQVAEARLQQVKAGAKLGEINAQEAEVQRLQAQLAGEIAEQNATLERLAAEVKNARSEYDRHQQLHRQGAISHSLIDSKRLTLETTTANLEQARSTQGRTRNTLAAQIREAQATKERIAEVRPVDVQVAREDLNQSQATLKQAEEDLKLTYIRAPIDGRILKIHTHPGEVVESDGIVEIAQTKQMIAVAEVYQSDIPKVKLGQASTITGEAFRETLQGTVFEIGLQVNRQVILSNDPGENLDRRVVEVKVRLNPADSQKVAALTNLQVFVSIDPTTKIGAK